MWGLALGNVIGLGLTLAIGSAAFLLFYLNDESQPNQHHRAPGNVKKRKKRVSHLDTDQLCRNFADGTAKCTVCLENIKPPMLVWHCWNCLITYHLSCIKTWAILGCDGPTWSCPNCRYSYDKKISSILTYKCFCGSAENPPIVRGLIPHSCGSICGRGECRRKCHPGQCPNAL